MKKRYLVLHQGALGDLVLSFPVLTGLKNHAALDICCQAGPGRLALYLGLAKQAFPIEAGYFASLFSGDIAPELKRLFAGYDVIILFSFSDELGRKIQGCVKGPVYVVPPRPAPHEDVHVSYYLLERLNNLMPFKLPSSLPSGPEKTTPAPQFSLSGGGDISGSAPALRGGNKGEGDICGFINKHSSNRNSGRPDKILLHPGSGSRRKNWPLENFIEINTRLKSKGLITGWVLGPAEDFMLRELQTRGFMKDINLIHDLIAFADLLKQAKGFVGNDSGLSHLAAFLGMPVVAIFGPSDPGRWRPLGPNVVAVASETQCRPCFETSKTNCESQACLSGISPERVEAGILKTLGNTAFAAGAWKAISKYTCGLG